ncbi:MAG TPA: HD domain-containing protein [Burkholderiales bacterium]|nr:HD domain-containing protein [Burkholderiales bacterium]
MPTGTYRRNEYDVTDRIDTTDSQAVSEAVCRIYQDLYQRDNAGNILQAFDDLTRLYRGEYPGYHACDTSYHNIQHVLDVTLAMARLLDGAARTTAEQVLDERLFRFGIVTALYHDCGYIRHRKDTRHANGAEYTKTHVSRGGKFLENYLPDLGMEEFVPVASRTLHFTGYEMPTDRIRIDPQFRLIGNLLGSADILAQMADRCYLEKCYDRLYPEFVSGGIARQEGPNGEEQVLFESAAALIYQTPRFYHSAHKRLQVDLGGYCKYVEKHFGGENLYFKELDKNIEHARKISEQEDLSMLRRKPPEFDPQAPPEDDKLI